VPSFGYAAALVQGSAAQGSHAAQSCTIAVPLSFTLCPPQDAAVLQQIQQMTAKGGEEPVVSVAPPEGGDAGNSWKKLQSLLAQLRKVR